MAKTTTLTKVREIGELLIHEESVIYCRTSSLITNNLGGAVSVDWILGLPLKFTTVWELAAAADINGVGTTLDGLLLDGPELLTGLADAGVSNYAYSILELGPAVVNQDRLPATDGVGAAITLADLEALLQSNMNVKSIPTPPEEEIQTT